MDAIGNADFIFLKRDWVEILIQEFRSDLSRDHNKMIEYLSFILQCPTVILLGTTTYYLYSLLKMAEEIINELLPEVSYDTPELDKKQQKLIECVLTGNSKQYLGKAYTREQVNKLSAEKVDKLYDTKLSGQMVKSLSKLIIRIYSMGTCAILRMTNQDSLSNDLESDPFLNSALQRFMCKLYYRFGSFLTPLSVGLIKYEGLGAAMAAEIIIGFWFGIGVILAVRMVDSLDYCVEELMSKNKVIAITIAEQTQVQQETMKDPKKVEQDKNWLSTIIGREKCWHS